MNRVHLYRTFISNAVAQLLAVSICTAVLLLFVGLTYSHITLPRYTTGYTQKDTQQVVNLLITVVATILGILLSHCRRLTNEAETKTELRHDELTLPRLHVHFEAAGGSKAAMTLPATQNRAVWNLVAIYFIAMIVFGFLHSVLSVIFVIESIIASQGVQVPVYIPLSSEIPWHYNGETVDPCSTQISAPGCTYDLALTALSSHLVTYAPYTIGGVTFEPPNGTLGLPYYAMEHFTEEVKFSHFEEEHRQYCLPVLDPHIIRCEEEPFIQDEGRTESGLVKYEVLDVLAPPNSSSVNRSSYPVNDYRMYRLHLDYANPEAHRAGYDAWKYRTSDEGNGTMTVMLHPAAQHWKESILTASNSGDPEDGDYGYASLLYYLMYGVYPDVKAHKAPDGNFYFAARCHLTPIMYSENNLYSWRKVDFTLKNGVSRANVTEERCPNARDSRDPVSTDNGPISGFSDLPFALEGAAAVMSSSDGYSKLFNVNPHENVHGTDIWGGMSRLDAVVNQIYHLVQTAYSESTTFYAMKNQTIFERPVLMTRYPHLYIIRISWTPTTYIGLVLSILITLNAWLLAYRWLIATYRFGFDTDTWNLLRPVDLMAYSLAAYYDLRQSLDTFEHRRMAMRGEIGTFLRERPAWDAGQHSQSQVGLAVNAASGPQSPASTAFTSSPVTPLKAFDGKDIEKQGN